MPEALRALILTANEFEDMELFFPYFRLLEEGIEVDIAAPRKGNIQGEHGYEASVQKTFVEVDPDRYDLLLVPGGSPDGAPSVVRDSARAREIASSFFKANKPVASICHGPWLLASADLVRGRHLTSYWHDGVPESIRKAGGLYEDKEVVVDGCLVTSRYPGDLPAFMRETMRMVEGLRKRPSGLGRSALQTQK
ncbi:MAG TPA: type 1 glutamine amidotransferase domain-containing protein [Conexivisphaerales archaeon]|nr:type 1 glutamine amidotransferase domain-containing protein [Conexivisphaerales archaeon]